jgi:hypothetical protein
VFVLPSISSLVQAISAVDNQSRWQEAEQLWQRNRGMDPRHPLAIDAARAIETCSTAQPGMM